MATIMSTTVHTPQQTPAVAKVSQVKKRVRARRTGSWISSFIVGHKIPFRRCLSSEPESVWQMNSCISEAWTCYPPGDGEVFSYATGLFRCVQVAGDQVGHKAMAKVFLQVDGEPCRLPGGLAEEIQAYARIAKLEQDFPAAQILLRSRGRQTADLFVEGGFLEILILENIPGRMLTKEDFIKKPYSEREEIRHALGCAELQLRKAKVLHTEHNINFLNWDDEHKKCYINNLYGAMFFENSGGVSPAFAAHWRVSECSICVNLNRRAGTPWRDCHCKPCEDKKRQDQDTSSNEADVTKGKLVAENGSSSGAPSLTSNSEASQEDDSIDTPPGSPTSTRLAAHNNSTEHPVTTKEQVEATPSIEVQKIIDLLQSMEDTTSLNKIMAYVESLRPDTASSSTDKALVCES